ncbi:hypothetical protein [Sphingopyxis terrae]|uniref:hypothetical protein n=1 Tax=Sphingopyxis terrae TaxID=33052 RepID=UPI001C2C79AC|nr:hypothetical protein [Sphingopyxis terrae]QXF12468.1 hypothetical protein HBA51_10100 [Sphingopyxis terrae subsp. terrae]
MPVVIAAGDKPIGVGDRLYFLGYRCPVPSELLHYGQMLVVLAVFPDGVYAVVRIDDWGRALSDLGETVFAEEVMKVPLPPIPVDRLPPPFGRGQ